MRIEEELHQAGEAWQSTLAQPPALDEMMRKVPKRDHRPFAAAAVVALVVALAGGLYLWNPPNAQEIAPAPLGIPPLVVEVGNDYVIRVGAPAPVKVGFFTDFQCVYCAELAAEPRRSTLTDLLNDQKLQLSLHLATFLDRDAAGTSAWLANAALSVANESPAQFLDFYFGLLGKASEENPLTSQQAEQLAGDLGVPADVVAGFAALKYADWVKAANEATIEEIEKVSEAAAVPLLTIERVAINGSGQSVAPEVAAVAAGAGEGVGRQLDELLQELSGKPSQTVAPVTVMPGEEPGEGYFYFNDADSPADMADGWFAVLRSDYGKISRLKDASYPEALSDTPVALMYFQTDEEFTCDRCEKLADGKAPVGRAAYRLLDPETMKPIDSEGYWIILAKPLSAALLEGFEEETGRILEITPAVEGGQPSPTVPPK
ncbi:MAG: thioredoxin domain-containing protein [Propionibacteriaceae bacterium]|jgi:protein-disulfide isomerase|nr:thioredoxin domain-containing protein [Propionibacteriaceae bacterium]